VICEVLFCSEGPIISLLYLKPSPNLTVRQAWAIFFYTDQRVGWKDWYCWTDQRNCFCRKGTGSI